VKALDGVTTALELEIGAPDVAQFLKTKEGHSLINYGTSASHPAARALVFGAPLPPGEILPTSGPATDQPATSEQIMRIEQRLRSELDAGGLAVGMGIQYTRRSTVWWWEADFPTPIGSRLRDAADTSTHCAPRAIASSALPRKQIVFHSSQNSAPSFR
jgi:hypothetical protein